MDRETSLGTKKRRKSTLPGAKSRSTRINATGKLSDSLRFAIMISKKSFGFQILAEDYADVVDAGRRKGKGLKPSDLHKLETWIRKKPVRLQKPGGGFLSLKPHISKRKGKSFGKEIDPVNQFARFISWKLKHFPLAPTFFLKDAITDTEKNFTPLVFGALFKDVEQAYSVILNELQRERNL